jgi:hypothetical protein
MYGEARSGAVGRATGASPSPNFSQFTLKVWSGPVRQGAAMLGGARHGGVWLGGAGLDMVLVGGGGVLPTTRSFTLKVRRGQARRGLVM